MKNSKDSGKNSEVLAELNASSADVFTCWNDLYEHLLAFSSSFVEAPSPQGAMFAIAIFSSFVLALRDLPEEGDVAVITRKMNDILINDSERTGMRIFTVGTEEMAEAIQQTVRTLAEKAALEALEAAEPPLDRKLH